MSMHKLLATCLVPLALGMGWLSPAKAATAELGWIMVKPDQTQ
jgi:hypothetical protein